MHVSDFMPYMQFTALAINAMLVLFIVPLRRSIEELRSSDDRMSVRMQALELKVAENYVQRGELNLSLQQILTKLDTLDARFTSKMDSLETGKVDK